MKNGSRGNYRVLYRDLNPEELYSHFTIVETQGSLLEELGLEPKKALKAVREMARTHFSEIEPDGFIAEKKAWYGKRWQALYRQWGDYLSERDLSKTDDRPTPIRTADRRTDQPARPAKVRPFLKGLVAQRQGYLNLAAAVLVFLTGYMASRVHQEPAARVPQGSSPSQGMMRDDGSLLIRPGDQMERKGKLLYFPNLEGTRAVFAVPGKSFALVDGQTIRVGDHIILNDNRGVVSELHTDRLMLRTDAGTMQFPFPSHQMMGQETYAAGQIVIYPEPGNLMGILQGLCTINGWKLAGSRANHTISGRFGDLKALLAACASFGILTEDDVLIVPETTAPKSYISYDGIAAQSSGTVEQLLERFAPHLPYKVEMKNIPSTQRWVINHGMQFDEFCDFFNLHSELRGNHIIVKGGNDEQGKGSD